VDDGQRSKLGWVTAGTASSPVTLFIRCRDLALWVGPLQMREERLILNARRDPVAEAAAALVAEVRAEVKASGAGVRIVRCQPPTKSPWLNPIEPKRARGQHKGVEPGRLLPMTDLEERVSAALGADHAGHLARLDRVA
jgi:hypothetical protein